MGTERMSLRSPPRIGLLGGSFNPIHMGHLILAQSALEAFDLAQVWFIPAAQPPHKGTGAVLPAAHRLAMVEAAIEGDWRYEVNQLELLRPGPSYAIDTVRELRECYPAEDLCFIIGSDTLTELHLWKDINDLLPLCRFLTLARPGWDISEITPERIKLASPWPERLLADTAETRRIDISSSDIRHRVAEGLSIRYLVPPAVEMYIAEHHLYRSE
jgi:nicotinate-nucleotide adenylyltransferase